MDEIASLVRYVPGGEGRNRALAFISPNPGAGTTTTAANFAKYLAEGAGAKVVLVDVNLRHPTLHEVAGVERAGGLTELLTEQQSVEEVTKPTSLPLLHVVTSGVSVEHAHRLLRPEDFKERVLEPTREYDFVILDCAPVNPYFESLAIAALCDGVILVVEGENTRRQPAQTAKEQLQQSNCRLLGVVMNKRKYYIPKMIYQRL